MQPVGKMKLKIRTSAQAQESRESDDPARRRRQAVDHERQGVRTLRIADQERVRLAPQARVILEHPTEVLSRTIRRAGRPEILERVPADDRNVMLRERARNAFVESDPPPVARQEDGK